MRVIITGGSGLIGRELTQRLSADGHEVIILSRSPRKVKGLPENARAEKWDAQTAAGWGELADGADAIINLAGANIGAQRWSDERKKVILESRTNASAAVVEAVKAAANKPKIVIQASAVGYYGNRGDELLTEESTAGDNFLAHVCIEWEKAIQPIAEMTRLIIARTGVVLTTTDGALQRMMLPFKFFAGGPLGSGAQWFPWIHLDDEVRALLFLLQEDVAAGAYNLSSPHIMTNGNFVKVLGSVMGRPALVPAPAFALKIALGEMSDLVLDSQRMMSTKLQSAGFDFSYPNAEEALRDLVSNSK